MQQLSQCLLPARCVAQLRNAFWSFLNAHMLMSTECSLGVMSTRRVRYVSQSIATLLTFNASLKLNLQTLMLSSYHRLSCNMFKCSSRELLMPLYGTPTKRKGDCRIRIQAVRYRTKSSKKLGLPIHVQHLLLDVTTAQRIRLFDSASTSL